MAGGNPGFRREIEVFVDEALEEGRRLNVFVATAQDTIDQFKEDWNAATGGKAIIDVFVDGRRNGELKTVQAGGSVAARARTLGFAVERALELYDLFVRIVTGRFASQLVVFAGDSEVDRSSADEIQAGTEVIITNLAPFARKAELRGYNDKEGSGFTNGLFEGLAVVLKQELEGLATVEFQWRDFAGVRLPTILIR